MPATVAAQLRHPLPKRPPLKRLLAGPTGTLARGSQRGTSNNIKRILATNRAPLTAEQRERLRELRKAAPLQEPS